MPTGEKVYGCSSSGRRLLALCTPTPAATDRWYRCRGLEWTGPCGTPSWRACGVAITASSRSCRSARTPRRCPTTPTSPCRRATL